MEYQMSLSKAKDNFISRLSKDSGIPEKEVIELLKEKYNEFNPKRQSEYYAYIMNVSSERSEEEQRLEIENRFKQKDSIDLEVCPLCNGKVFGTNQMDYYTKEQKWECANNKFHYIRWRTNRILNRKGLQPLSDKEWEDAKRSN